MGSHKKWRAQAKKMRRKRIRQKLAQERDELILIEQERKEKSPKYQAWLSEQKALELFAEEEEARLAAERHAAWLAEEDRAQKAWKERQERLTLARAERAKQELRIREEWEEEQKKVKAAKLEQELLAEEKKHKQEELMRQIENFINKGCDMPPEVNVASVTNPDRPSCPFFTKTGACRFGDRCSRNHTRPAISRVLLVPNFYDHIGLRQMNPDELEGEDDWLEYEDSETYHHFLDFYDDVLPEWERVGRISQFKVCCNFEPHLKGNVYIEYESAQDAVRAFKTFHGRYYGGKQINVEFVTIDSWKAAICGQFHKHCCPKGRSCNFLHVFRNPRNAFYSADRDNQEWRRKQLRDQIPSPSRTRGRSWSGSPDNTSRRREWRWSESPSPPPPERSDSSSQHSTRSHHSKSRHSYRKRTSKQLDEYSSDRSRGHSSEKYNAKVRHSDEDRYYRSRRYPRTSSRKDDAYEPKDSMDCERTNRHQTTDDKTKFSKTVGHSNHEVNQSGKEPCDISYNLSPSDCVVNENSGQTFPQSVHETVPTKSSGEIEPNSSDSRIKDRKSKKKKKEEDSHRKEKKRKKKSRAKSDSSHSSDA